MDCITEHMRSKLHVSPLSFPHILLDHLEIAPFCTSLPSRNVFSLCLACARRWNCLFKSYFDFLYTFLFEEKYLLLHLNLSYYSCDFFSNALDNAGRDSCTYVDESFVFPSCVQFFVKSATSVLRCLGKMDTCLRYFPTSFSRIRTFRRTSKSDSVWMFADEVSISRSDSRNCSRDEYIYRGPNSRLSSCEL